MKKGTIILICIAGALLLLAGFCVSKYNGLVEAEAAVDQILPRGKRCLDF